MTAPQEPTVSELFDLSGKNVLLTGGTGHLGSAMARALAEAGASVIVTSRAAERARAFAKTLPVVGDAKHHGLALDQMKHTKLADRFAAALALTGSVDVLVNNGHHPLGKDWKEVAPDEFTKQLANATSYFHLSKLLRDHAVERKAAGNVIMLGSMYGMVASYPDAYEGITMASPVAYHALKGGILQMTRHLAAYWAEDGLRVNSLSPGPFPGPNASAEMVDRLKEKVPTKRMGNPSELKGAIVFLASEASSYMTGQNLVIDGGWTAW